MPDWVLSYCVAIGLALTGQDPPAVGKAFYQALNPSSQKIDWVAYYKNHGYGPTITWDVPNSCLSIPPTMNWAVPNSCLTAPPAAPVVPPFQDHRR